MNATSPEADSPAKEVDSSFLDLRGREPVHGRAMRYRGLSTTSVLRYIRPPSTRAPSLGVSGSYFCHCCGLSVHAHVGRLLQSDEWRRVRWFELLSARSRRKEPPLRQATMDSPARNGDPQRCGPDWRHQLEIELSKIGATEHVLHRLPSLTARACRVRPSCTRSIVVAFDRKASGSKKGCSLLESSNMSASMLRWRPSTASGETLLRGRTDS